MPTRAGAAVVNFHGKVVMQDGSAPGRLVGIQRTCEGVPSLREANASPKTGEYFVHLWLNDFGAVFSGGPRYAGTLTCYLEAVLPGYTSTRLNISDRRITSNPQLPDIVLSRKAPAVVDLKQAPTVPRPARKPWEQAVRHLATENWAGAEPALRAVVAAAPGFVPAWSALGAACQNQGKHGEARTAFERAISLDPKQLTVYLPLARAQMELKDWPAAVGTSEALIQADIGHMYLEAYLYSAVARLERKDTDGALARVNEAIRLDTRRELSRAEYILGVILEAKGQLDAAAAHLRKYIDEHPRAKDAAAVKERLANLGKQPAEDLAAELSSADFRAPAGEAPVPGGIKAFSAIARIPGTPSYRDFFLEYCRAIIRGAPNAASPTTENSAAIRTFISTMADFERLGERKPDRITIRLAVDTGEHRVKTELALALLGWRLRQSGQELDIEPGTEPVDGYRQRIPAAFGIDELAMRDAIAGRRPFEFDIPVESARLVGGAAWSATLRDRPEARFGPAEVFLRDWRFARAYAGLAAMDSETAAAVVSAVGLVPLIANHSVLLAECGEALSLSGERVAVPGGVEAEPAWAGLTDADPKNPRAFLRVLFQKDNGLPLLFFFDLSRADGAHQRFLTASAARAGAFYKWYRDSAPARAGARWQAAILQKMGLSADGSIELPGGSRASAEALLRLPSLEPAAALVRLEESRSRALDPDSAALLTRRYGEWRGLFPYFEKLPGLGGPQFEALAAFADHAAAAPREQRAVLLGHFHSLVELIVLASEAGSLNASQAADAFGLVCGNLRSAGPSTKAMETLRALAGESSDVDDAIASRLLRLTGARRDAFESVKRLQGVPRIAGLGKDPGPAKTLAALSGTVYAALLDPGGLLVSEDPELLVRHDFLPGGELFAGSGFVASSVAPGSHLTGGFAGFEEVARVLNARTARQVSLPETPAAVEILAPAAAGGPAPSASGEPVFRAQGRIVEVYTTVTDTRGRYVDDLARDEFQIQVEGQRMHPSVFENRTTSVSVALLFDMTGSMSATLPSLKSAAMRLVDELRPGDSAAVYGFNDGLTEFQPLTTDKTAIKRAVLRAHAAGTTALYDALVRAGRDLARVQGKKAIIVFTDGDDNASMLTAEIAIQRAKSYGIPIYTVAQGEALKHPRLVARLTSLSQFTGGAPFLIQKLTDIGAAFDRMSADLVHGYLLAFQPPTGDDKTWHSIAVSSPARKNLVIRARQGYISE